MPRDSRHTTPVSPRSSIVGFTVRMNRRHSATGEDMCKTDASSDEEESPPQIASPSRRQARAEAQLAQRARHAIGRSIAVANTAAARVRIMEEYGTEEQQRGAEASAQDAVEITRAERTSAIAEATKIRRGQGNEEKERLEEEAEHERAVADARSRLADTADQAVHAGSNDATEQLMEMEESEVPEASSGDERTRASRPATGNTRVNGKASSGQLIHADDGTSGNKANVTPDTTDTRCDNDNDDGDDGQQDNCTQGASEYESDEAMDVDDQNDTSENNQSQPPDEPTGGRGEQRQPTTQHGPETTGSARAEAKQQESTTDWLENAAAESRAASERTPPTPTTTGILVPTCTREPPAAVAAASSSQIRERTEQTPSQEPDAATGIYEGEGALDIEYTTREWQDFESRFRDTAFRVTFALDTQTVLVPDRGYWGLQELTAGITQVCASRQVTFDEDGLRMVGGANPILMGNARVQDRALWRLMRRGYIKVHGATVWVQPMFTGRQQSNLDLVEIEYRNANYVSIEQLRTIMNHWGALEPLIVSHGAITSPATGEIQYAFRLCFEDETTANAVYRSFLRQEQVEELGIPHARTIRLTPVVNTEWCATRERMIRPSALAELADISRRLHIFGVRSEVTGRQVERRLEALGFGGMQIAVQAGRTSGTATAPDDLTATRLYDTYGPNTSARITIGNIRMFVNRPGEHGGMRCFGCNQTGHFRRDCRTQQGRTGHGARSTAQVHGSRGEHERAPTRGHTNERYKGPCGRAADELPPPRPDAWRQMYPPQHNNTNDAVAPGWRLPVLGANHEVTRTTRNDAALDHRSIMLQVRNLIATQVQQETGRIAGELRTELATQTQELNVQLNDQAREMASIRTAQATTATDTSRLVLMVTAMARFMKVPDFSGGSQEDGTGTPQ